MRLYTAWHPGDPIYPQYDKDCALLISTTAVSKRWNIGDLPEQPTSLIVDSGGFRYSFTGNVPTQRQVFERQISMIGTASYDITLCHLDHPMVDSQLTSNQRDNLIHKTLANAYEFIRLADQKGVSDNVRLMGIVQGYDVDSLAYCARELKNMGYSHFGVGSLAFLFNNEQIIERIRAVIKVTGIGIHVFGITGARIAPTLRDLGVGSIDSSRPVKAAMYNVIFSSEPFKRHRIRPTRGNYSQSTYIEEPFVCSCPVCEGGINPDLLKMGKKQYIFLRTIHNYYHLKKSICSTSVCANTIKQ